MDNLFVEEQRCLVCGVIDFINEDGLCPECEQSTIYRGDKLDDKDY